MKIFDLKGVEELLDCGLDFCLRLKLAAAQSLFERGEEPKIAWCEVGAVWWMADTFNTIFCKEFFDVI